MCCRVLTASDVQQGAVTCLCCHCSWRDVAHLPLSKGLWATKARKACLSPYCKMWADAAGHPGISGGSWRLTTWVLTHMSPTEQYGSVGTRAWGGFQNTWHLDNIVSYCHDHRRKMLLYIQINTFPNIPYYFCKCHPATHTQIIKIVFITIKVFIIKDCI